jgi:heme-degrading monooxygenase HmoA
MLARIISATVQPAKISEFRTLLNNKLLPVVQSQPGFLENIEALDPNTGQFSCTTLWKSREDIERYDNSVFPEIASKMSPMLQGNPVVQTLPVENSSTQRVRAAAASASSR